jgi:energy-coupling factor transport system permease protein
VNAVLSSLFARTLISYAIVFVVPLLLPVAFFKLVGLGGLRELVTYEAKDTPLHRLDPRLKVLYPVAMGILSILLTWSFMLVVFALSILPWFWLRPSRQRVRVLLVMAIGPALGGFWGQGMYYLPPPPIHFIYQFPWTISWLGSPGITTYGMIFGLEQSARVLVSVSTSMLILISTDVGDFTWAFERFGAPPQLGFALTAALRFLPELIARTTLVLRAVELRGYDLSRPQWFQVALWPDYVGRVCRCVALITVPLLVGTLRGTATMAMVADARGFGITRKRGSLRVHKLTPVDIGGYVILVLLVGGALILNHLHIGARYYG